MAIEDRLRQQITLTSPASDGKKDYTASWIGDPITKEKKLGRFNSPKTKGTTIQDLDVRGDLYRFTIFFGEEDHDLDANDFWKSLDANGSWTVIHPLNGLISNLYLSRAVWENEPVRSNSFTQFATEWVQGRPEEDTVSLEEQKQQLISDADQSDLTAQAQLVGNVKTNLFEEAQALQAAAEKAVAEIQSNLRAFENLQIINPRLEALFRGISNIFESFPPDTSALAAQFAGVYEAIGLAQNSASDTIENMSEIITAQSRLFVGDVGAVGRNAAAMAELNASLANSQIAKAVLLGDIETREQAVDIANSINTYLDDIIARFETEAERFNDTPIENQYVAFGDGFGDLVKANRRALQYLFSVISDLKIERVFTIRVPRGTIEIAWTELGGPGEIIEEDFINIDQNYADFCNWNDLHGNDLIWLPAGSVVRVFI
jgi:hypothetical protein